MKLHRIGALLVVSDFVKAKLEGIVTDRDLCCGIIAEGGFTETKIAEVTTPDPVTCAPEDILEDSKVLNARSSNPEDPGGR